MIGCCEVVQDQVSARVGERGRRQSQKQISCRLAVNAAGRVNVLAYCPRIRPLFCAKQYQASAKRRGLHVRLQLYKAIVHLFFSDNLTSRPAFPWPSHCSRSSLLLLSQGAWWVHGSTAHIPPIRTLGLTRIPTPPRR